LAKLLGKRRGGGHRMVFEGKQKNTCPEVTAIESRILQYVITWLRGRGVVFRSPSKKRGSKRGKAPQEERS